MALAEQDFELSLLDESALADDPYPGQPLQLDVVCRDASQDGRMERLVIRTSPRQLDAFFDQYRALRYSLMARARKQAEQDAVRAEAAEVALSPETAGADQRPDRTLLQRVLEGLERTP